MAGNPCQVAPTVDPFLARRLKAGAVCSLLVISTAIGLSAARDGAGASEASAPVAPPAPSTTLSLPPQPVPVAPAPPAPDVYARAATTCPGLPPQVLAAVHRVESRGARTSSVSSAGARGPMQFLPSTWKANGVDGDGDGRADINDLTDAVFSAANHLCANGAGDPKRLRSALWNYNHSTAYVDRVLAVAAAT